MATVSSCLATIVALITLTKFVCDSTPCSQIRFTKTYINEIDDEYSSLLMRVSNVSHFECSRGVSRDPLLLLFVYNTQTRECATSERWDIPTTEVLNSNNVLYQKVGVDGVFTTWSPWGPCSVTCGSYDEVRTRTRSCTNPPPYNGGEDCVGHNSETQSFYCELPICPVHGKWSSWGSWIDTCSATCGSSRTFFSRSRSCTDPSPQHGGDNCAGSKYSNKSVQCGALPACPVNGQWSEWGSWPNPNCLSECNVARTIYMSRSRLCNNPSPANGGSSCPGDTTENAVISCDVIPCDYEGLGP